ncbi:metal ABC transporter ATPase [Pseudomonas alliivorans]|uniref:Metal ABC transporter ATPase n=1 Tax=Pseudomonas alliivorans TaxID=2810613 RepID=A0ABS4C8A6_9PSED|nr:MULTISPECIES: metal ABC transporter ATPase [Pseudomonas]MBP0946896.1 metal ABC transporter ATPase [Pseudomonas alliivorans]MBP0951197.1 metal ABC transporter ATPase [Pseudomonas alliivorans]MEE4327147.1 metal ABC transporter ATPase [Pseudomonas alliivorans]MEE4334682.1 metal ABC transporter ATPase [Pseudomonas alliivorans]MEE4342134.1 metal ABC transporter ATPase [Pseudomonas alliivorans]
MPRTLIRKNPSNFKTLPLFVEATPESLSYQSVGMPMNFTQTLQRRRKVEVPDPERFATELANLGVSIRLTISWQNRDYWVLVRQRRQDRGDVVLKLISGYVPAHELTLPLHTAIQEVAEECLIETPQGWLSGLFKDTWLPAPYASALHYREAMPFTLSPLSGAARPVRAGNLTLLERPRAYVHLPTASLQLIYDMRLEIPKEARPISLFHVDEMLENDQLVARLNRSKPDLYLMPLENGSPLPELYTLKRDKLTPAGTRGLYLAESFAAQDGWVVREERIRWKDWLRQQGMTPPPKKTGLKRLTSKARELLGLARGSLSK